MQSQLNDAIRDVDKYFDDHDVAASNRQIAEEVMLRYPDACRDKATELMMADLVRRVSKLRKKSQGPDASDPRQLAIPEFAKHLLPHMPAKIPLYPEDADKIDEDEIPWRTMLACSVDQIRRYNEMLLSQVRADIAKQRRVQELLDAGIAGCAGDMTMPIVEALKRVKV